MAVSASLCYIVIPGWHANVVNPCLLPPCLNLPDGKLVGRRFSLEIDSAMISGAMLVQISRGNKRSVLSKVPNVPSFRFLCPRSGFFFRCFLSRRKPKGDGGKGTGKKCHDNLRQTFSQQVWRLPGNSPRNGKHFRCPNPPARLAAYLPGWKRPCNRRHPWRAALPGRPPRAIHNLTPPSEDASETRLRLWLPPVVPLDSARQTPPWP